MRHGAERAFNAARPRPRGIIRGDVLAVDPDARSGPVTCVRDVVANEPDGRISEGPVNRLFVARKADVPEPTG